ncbi:DUF1080 domain-containing protein [Marinihelvus fidelis]|uniref:DUF1080 domain-containing protein n=1 Tax=Marinihelvus fidelis TaxID=2613842 RepID=A0A5N0TJA4_9GAMM|nr:DUF1080 domain-containing protein [Marinihelvus fidelis]KAA9134187.1 DUF1080 domain-containing protein [Marinihelvus fidelis]
MKMKLAISLTGSVLLLASTLAWCQDMAPEETEVWEPEPPVVTPGDAGAPPSDAIVLFDGSSLDAWTQGGNEAPTWTLSGGAMTVNGEHGGKGNIQTKQGFGDVQLHIEWRTSPEDRDDGQGRGNSGIFLMGLYEVQVLDSFENRTYSNGQATSVYKQHIPLANAMRPPGEWQVYDIIFRAPAFSTDGELESAATVTVIHNGVLVQDHVEIRGPTVYIGEPAYQPHEDRLPLALQDHGDMVSYRNIWLRELE